MAEYRYDIDDFYAIDECGKYLKGGQSACGGLTVNQSQKSTISRAGSCLEGLGGKWPAAAAVKRTFETGAIRDTDSGKLDFEGFLSPLVLERYAEYMHSHRVMADGSIRDSCNWQRGIPLDVYMKSLWRHFFDMWKLHRGVPAKDTLEVVLCAVLFNVMGYLHETLKKKQTDVVVK